MSLRICCVKPVNSPAQRSSSDARHRVVITPEALGRSLLNPSASPLLDSWRDDQLCPVVCRSLLVRYFRLLHQLALPERLVRWWGWWLGSPVKTLILPDPDSWSTLEELCDRLAVDADASCVVGERGSGGEAVATTPAQEGRQWIPAAELLRRLGP